MTTLYDIEDVQAEKQRRIEFIEAVLASRSMLAFTKFTFPEFEFNWHIKILCDELNQWIIAKKPYNLMIFAPPRHGKTELCARRLVPYLFGINPDAEIIMSSYGADLLSENSMDIKRTVRLMYGTTALGAGVLALVTVVRGRGGRS